MGILDFFAERDGDTDARIALRTKDLIFSVDVICNWLSSVSRRTVEASRPVGRKRACGCSRMRRFDKRLVLFTAALLSKAGREREAEGHLWRAFEKAPSLEALHAASQVRRQGGISSAREKLLESRTVE